MSDLRVNNLKARVDGNVPTIVGGAVISGITSITGKLEAESGITAENLSASGIATISTAIVGTAVTINSSGVVATGVVTATTGSFSGTVTANSFSGDGSGLTGVASTDNINTSTLAQFTGGVGIADSIFHIGDDNTAIRFPATDTFTVETGGGERLRVDSSGRSLIGSTSARSAGDVTAQLQVEGTSFSTASLNLISNAGASAGNVPHITLGKSRGSSDGSSTVVADDDGLGSIQWAGADGTDLNSTAALISAAVDGAPGSNDMPGRLMFHTTADGASSPTERMRIHSGGVVSFNNGIELGSGLDATAANTLEDYEEGTYTPSASGFTVSGTTTMTGKYVKIGQQVTVGIKFVNTGTIQYGVSCNISLPFTMAFGSEANGLIGMLLNSNSESFNSNQSGTQCKLDGEGGARFFVGNFTTTSSGEQLMFGGTYISNQ